MKRILFVLLTLLVGVSLAFTQAAKPRDKAAIDADKATAKSMLAECLKILKADATGFDELVKAINSLDPRFVKGAVYVTVGGFDGTMHAHPVKALQGVKLPLTTTDADKKPMPMLPIARDKGAGEAEYRFNDSNLKKVVLKWVVVQKIPKKEAYLSISVNLEE